MAKTKMATLKTRVKALEVRLAEMEETDRKRILALDKFFKEVGAVDSNRMSMIYKWAGDVTKDVHRLYSMFETVADVFNAHQHVLRFIKAR